MYCDFTRNPENLDFNALAFCNERALTLSYSSKIIIYLYPQRVSLQCRDMLSEGYGAHPVGCDSHLQIVMVVWRAFFKILTSRVRV